MNFQDYIQNEIIEESQENELESKHEDEKSEKS